MVSTIDQQFPQMAIYVNDSNISIYAVDITDDSVASDVTLSKPPIASAKPIQHSHKQSRSELSSVHSNAADSLAYSSSTSAFTSFTGLEGTRVF